MKGYYKNEESNKEVMKDGRFQSGENAVYHTNGNIQVNDIDIKISLLIGLSYHF